MARSQPVLRLTGNSLKRFVTDATLLALIDPVRGEPTTYSLDRHPHDTRLNRERLQKKALDSFALICSTSRKGAETASAATLEEGYLSGGSTIIRVARNHGVPPDVLSKLQSIVQDLVSFSQQGMA
jgi:hypothetical protein